MRRDYFLGRGYSVGECWVNCNIHSYFEKETVKVGNNDRTPIPRGNMGYDLYTVPDTVAFEPTFLAILYHSQTCVHGLSCHSFNFLRRTVNSKPPTIHFGINTCTFSDKPFSKKSCISISGKCSTLWVEFTTGTILTISNNSMTYSWFLPGLWWLSEVLPSCQDGFNSQTLGALNKNTAAKTANTTTTSWARTLLTSNGRNFIKGSVFIAVTWENKQD